MKKTLAFALSCSLLLSACDDNTVQPDSPVVAPSTVLSQSAIDDFANTLALKYQLATNIADEQCDKERADGNCFLVNLQFTAQHDFSAKDWAIYYSQINPVQSVDSDYFSIEHINGDLHKITPTDKFPGFKSGQDYTLPYRVDFWSLSETDALPNYIFAVNGFNAVVIKSTEAQMDSETGLEISAFVEDYSSVEKHFKRSATDQTQWATAEVLFDRNLTLKQAEQSLSNALIPSAKSLEVNNQQARIDLHSGVRFSFDNVAKASLQGAIDRLKFIGISETEQGVDVRLSVDVQLSGNLGSYQLISNEQGINISANNEAGLFYGLQSIAALVSLDDLSIAQLSIDDEPHYPFRGMMVDVARNFHSKQFILDLIEQMAAYKLNKLHLHLGDDEGWRLEIDGLPELTDISSKRCFDLTEQTCLLPQLGAGVNASSSVNGFYSKADYKEILQYASARHIQVIPSLDMPGHSRSSIVAMKARYKKLMAAGDEQGAKQYLLHDENDKTVYSSVQYYNDNTINACMESSYDFIGKVMDEVKAMHANAGQPLTRYHIGADETAGAWVESPICKAFIANNKLGISKAEQLGSYFVERVAKILSDRDIETAGWNDGMMHTNPNNMPATVQANAWSLIQWQGHKEAHKLANQNWQIVVSNPDVTYFDFPYEADPKEHGYYWAARHSNTEKLFQFMPDNLPAHAEFWLDREDKPYATDDTEAVNEHGELERSTLTAGKTFIGVQGQLWSENTRNDDLAEYKIFPRLFALAERAWHKPQWAVPYNYAGQKYDQSSASFTNDKRELRDQQWADFANTMSNKELAKLDKADIFYRIPTVGGKIIDGKLHINSAYPNLHLEYMEQGKTWKTWTNSVEVTGKVAIRARSTDRQRAGRSLFLNE
ncbi:family 20 glycosylhydrolase [Thalassotalea sp. ND16A]|uniref:family 20 glycosylhydrolase n=1 Tax=Thalassotalea sp. ND16A TaxID=1535422 RepID=UPI00051A11FA|nr:family 20 glycosylhydrolase [Thalassotalea sp. ND16A]KGK00997.1 Beta-N-acetylhexosaminidase [Thalassotalea sp. ND16A]